MTPEPTVPRFAMGRNIAALAVLVAVGSLAVVAGLVAVDAREQVVPALGGAAVALLAGTVGLLPLHWADRRPPATAPMLAMAGTGLRMITTVFGALVLIGAGELMMPAAALWVLGWYLVVMVFEIALLIRYFRSIPPGSQAGSQTGGSGGTQQGSPNDRRTGSRDR